MFLVHNRVMFSTFNPRFLPEIMPEKSHKMNAWSLLDPAKIWLKNKGWKNQNSKLTFPVFDGGVPNEMYFTVATSPLFIAIPTTSNKAKHLFTAQYMYERFCCQIRFAYESGLI
jgi:hypothetical protein